MSLLAIYFLREENARRDRGERDEVIQDVTLHGDDKPQTSKGGVYESIEHARREKGDCWSGYRYTL